MLPLLRRYYALFTMPRRRGAFRHATPLRHAVYEDADCAMIC